MRWWTRVVLYYMPYMPLNVAGAVTMSIKHTHYHCQNSGNFWVLWGRKGLPSFDLMNCLPHQNSSTSRNPFYTDQGDFLQKHSIGSVKRGIGQCSMCFVCVGGEDQHMQWDSTRPYIMRIKQRIKTSPSLLSAHCRQNSWKLPILGHWTNPNSRSHPGGDECKRRAVQLSTSQRSVLHGSFL